MSDIVVVTNRSLCQEDFFVRIEKIAEAHPRAIILREKDLSEQEYKIMAKKVLEICTENGTECILHSYAAVAEELQAKALHLPMHILRDLSREEKAFYATLGASCHSVEEAVEAQKLGCTYITAGHIFDTDCKKGLPGRGLSFLGKVCEAVTIPVYAIGGISPENVSRVRENGAAGACVMSGAMVCPEVDAYLNFFEKSR